MGQLVEVLAVTVEELEPDGALLGASIDAPASGRTVAAKAVEISGWALGSAATLDRVEVELVLDGAVVARAPAHRPRPDIAAAFPGVDAAKRAGFEVVLDASRAPAESEPEVRARAGSSAVPVGRLRLRRCWRGGPAPGARPLVSVVVACGEAGQDLDGTMASVGEQRHAPTEVLIVHLPSSQPVSSAWDHGGVRRVQGEGSGAAALRNAGIRRSSGQLIAFLEAGSSLTAGALERGVEALVARPEAAGLVDGEPGGEVAGAIYRRSVFEELGGFEGPSARSCDAELAARAARGYDVLFEPGALTASGESRA